jgi:hypothetical protein
MVIKEIRQVLSQFGVLCAAEIGIADDMRSSGQVNNTL